MLYTSIKPDKINRKSPIEKELPIVSKEILPALLKTNSASGVLSTIARISSKNDLGSNTYLKDFLLE